MIFTSTTTLNPLDISTTTIYSSLPFMADANFRPDLASLDLDSNYHQPFTQQISLGERFSLAHSCWWREAPSWGVCPEPHRSERSEWGGETPFRGALPRTNVANGGGARGKPRSLRASEVVRQCRRHFASQKSLMRFLLGGEKNSRPAQIKPPVLPAF